MGAPTRQTEDQRKTESIEGRISAVEGRVMACETQIQVIGERLTGHIDASVAHRESVAGQLAGLSEVGRSTQALLREQIEEARAEREAKRMASEAEAEHRRKMEIAAVAAADARGSRAWEAARAVATHPAVIALLTAITSAVGAWTYATWGEVPVRSVTPVSALSAPVESAP